MNPIEFGPDSVLSLALDRVHVLVLKLPVARARLKGMYFAHDKCFLLPGALEGMRGLKRIYDRFPESEVLIVGHTDTTGEEDYNRNLSLLRARAVEAFLKDDVEAWYRHYDPGEPGAQRWGSTEDELMLATVQPDVDTVDPTRTFQEREGLTVDGIIGPQTRRALIKRYMAADETSLPPAVTTLCHGCGEHFPEIETADDVAEDKNRRVEVFFFRFGITPRPSSETSTAESPEYPQWKAAVTEEHDFDATHDDRLGRIHMQVFDALGVEPLAERTYTLRSEEVVLDGVTDAEGLIRHEDVVPDDYTLEVEGISDPVVALVLRIDDPNPQIRYLAASSG